MPNPAGPLNHAVAIVDAAGRPTQQFMRLWSLLETESAETGLVSIDRIPVGEISFPLSQLSDVNLTGPVDGQVLTYHAASGTWRNATGAGGGGTTFSGLSDVSFVSLMDEDLVAYSSGSGLWRNRKLVNADIGVSLVTQHQAALILSGNQITSGVVAAAYGGTGFGGTYVQGSLLYGNALGGLDRTLGGATTDYLRGGPAPSWQNLNTAIDARIDTNRNITSIWSWTTGELRINDDSALLMEERIGEPAGVIGYVQFYFNASDSGRPYYKLGTGGTPIAFSVAGHTHGPADITGGGTFGSGNYTFPGNLTLSGATASLQWSGLSSGNNFVAWGGGGMRKITTQGGLGLFCDSMMLLHAGDNILGLISDLGITAGSNFETLFLTADGHVYVITNRQTSYASRHEWSFRDTGTFHLPTGQITSAGVVLGLTWNGAVISEVYGGTGFGGTYVEGSLLYGNNLGGLSRTLGGATTDYLRGGATPSWQNLNTAIDARIDTNRNITSIWSWTTGELRINDTSALLMEERIGAPAGVAGYVQLYFNASDSGRPYYKLGTGGTPVAISVAGHTHVIGDITPGTLGAGFTWNGNVISAVYGGTGFGGSYVAGSILHGNGSGGLSRTIAGATTDYLRGGATPSWQNLNTAIDARVNVNRNITTIWTWTTGQLRIDDTGNLLIEEFAGTKTGVAGYVTLYPNASNSGRMSYKLGTGGTLYWLPRGNAAETITAAWTFGAGINVTGAVSATGDVIAGA